MIIKIDIPDFEDKERVLNYFYQMCLENSELNKFQVSIEGTDLKRIK